MVYLHLRGTRCKGMSVKWGFVFNGMCQNMTSRGIRVESNEGSNIDRFTFPLYTFEFF